MMRVSKPFFILCFQQTCQQFLKNFTAKAFYQLSAYQCDCGGGYPDKTLKNHIFTLTFAD